MPLNLSYFTFLFTQPFCHCAKQCVQLSCFSFYNWGIKSFQLMCCRWCSVCCRCCGALGPVASPLQHFVCGRMVNFEYRDSFVSFWGCGCLCIVRMCASVANRTIEWPRPRGSVHSFQYNPAELLCQVLPLTSSISSPSTHSVTSTHIEPIQLGL